MNRFIYIPGFLDTGKNRKMEPALEIWLKEVDPKEKIEAEYVIGHSLGANFSLLNWSHNKNTKLILTNPLVLNRSYFEWAWRFINFLLARDEKFTKQRWVTLLHLPLAIKRLFQLLNKNYLEILKEIPREDIIIYHGENDKYLCDAESMGKARDMGIRVVEIKGASHDFDKFREEALKYIK